MGIPAPFLSRLGRPMTRRLLRTALVSTELLCWANELVGRGILRKGFARFPWNMDGLGIVNGRDPHEKFMEELGVTNPVPGHEGERGRSPAATEVDSPGGDVDVSPSRDGVDLLVIMLLPLEVEAGTRANMESAREAALPSRDGSGGGNCASRLCSSSTTPALLTVCPSG